MENLTGTIQRVQMGNPFDTYGAYLAEAVMIDNRSAIVPKMDGSGLVVAQVHPKVKSPDWGKDALYSTRAFSEKSSDWCQESWFTNGLKVIKKNNLPQLRVIDHMGRE